TRTTRARSSCSSRTPASSTTATRPWASRTRPTSTTATCGRSRSRSRSGRPRWRRGSPSWSRPRCPDRPIWQGGVMESVYEAAGGRAGLVRLAQAWHARVMADEVVSHAFSHGFHPEHSERLAAYWAEALGGPPAYSGGCGDQTSVVRMHSGNGPHGEMDQRA